MKDTRRAVFPAKAANENHSGWHGILLTLIHRHDYCSE
jgi:hypothetical protein